MGRLALSLVVGVAGGVVIVALNLRHDNMLATLVGLAGGLLLGLLLGWRQPRPAHALGWGLLLGGLSGALMAGGQLYGLTLSADTLRLPGWLLEQVDEVTVFWWLAWASATVCFLFATVVSGSLAGMVAAWSGLREGAAGMAGVATAAPAPVRVAVAPASRPMSRPMSRPIPQAPARAQTPGAPPDAPAAPETSDAPAAPGRAAGSGFLLPGPLD